MASKGVKIKVSRHITKLAFKDISEIDAAELRSAFLNCKAKNLNVDLTSIESIPVFLLQIFIAASKNTAIKIDFSEQTQMELTSYGIIAK